MGIVEFATQIALRADMDGECCIIVSLILALAFEEKREAVLPSLGTLISPGLATGLDTGFSVPIGSGNVDCRNLFANVPMRLVNIEDHRRSRN